MQSIRNVLRGFRARAGAQPHPDAGMALIVVIGYGMVIMLVMSLLGVYAINSMRGARREQDYTAAVAAAQAGVDSVVAKLRKDPSAVATLPSSGWAAVPGSRDALGNSCEQTPVPVNCPQYKYATEVLPDGGVEIYALGKTRDNLVRAVKVTARQASYTDYLYYSEVEAADPADTFAYPNIPLLGMTGAPADCWKRAWPAADARPAVGCQIPAWRTGDKTDNSRVHSNDVFTVSGNPRFNSRVTTAYDGCAPSAAASPTCYVGAGAPDFDNGAPSYSTGLDLAVSAPDDLLAQARLGGCEYVGPTRIRFEGDQMRVWSPQTPHTAACGGGVPDNLSITLTIAGIPINIPLRHLNLGQIEQHLAAILPLAGDLVPVPQNNVVYIRDRKASDPPAAPLSCFLGKVANLSTGDLNALAPTDCAEGKLFIDGDMHGRVTVGADGDALIMSDLRYVDGSGNPTHSGDNALGIVASGAVEVYNPVQCALAVGTCLSLTNLAQALPGNDIKVDAAIMSLQHRFGTQLPILSPSLTAALINSLAVVRVNPPKLKLFGSVAQKYRGIIGADLLDMNLGLAGIDVASVDINIGYQAKLAYDQRLRTSPPPFFPKPASPAWTQDTFAEIPTSKVPAALLA